MFSMTGTHKTATEFWKLQISVSVNIKKLSKMKECKKTHKKTQQTISQQKVSMTHQQSSNLMDFHLDDLGFIP